MAGRLCSGPGLGHLWSGAREAAWPMIQHLHSPFLAKNSGSRQAPRRRGQPAGCRPALLAASPRGPCGAEGAEAALQASLRRGRRGRRSGQSRLRGAEAGSLRARAGGAAGEGTRSGGGHCSLAGSQGPRARCGRGAGGGCAGVPACLPACREELLRAGWACRCRRKRQGEMVSSLSLASRAGAGAPWESPFSVHASWRPLRQQGGEGGDAAHAEQPLNVSPCR